LKLEPPVDFVIIAPLPEERDALLAKFAHEKLPPTEEDIRVYYGAHLPVCFSDGSRGVYQVVVTALADMGLLEAGLAASDAIRRWRPRFLLLVGIAGGYGGRAALGDVLIASQVADYEGQKVTAEGTRIRWSVHPVDQRLLLAANSFRGEQWRDRIAVKRPRKSMSQPLIGVIASGNKSVARAAFLQELQGMWDRLIGVEMEGAGAAKAADQSPTRPGFFMIRAVSDLADENEGSRAVAKWRAYARDVAAAFTVAFLQSGPVTLQASAPHATGAPSAGTTPAVHGLPPHSFMPHTRNAVFVGREQDLACAHGALLDGGAAAIGQVAATGLGGIGKTQLACEYVTATIIAACSGFPWRRRPRYRRKSLNAARPWASTRPSKPCHWPPRSARSPQPGRTAKCTC